MIACTIFCNPILDLIKSDCSDDWYKQYNLSKDGYQMYDAQKNKDIFDVLIKDPSVIRLAGGSGQNTARMMAACLKGKSEIAFVGCVGGCKVDSHVELDPYAQVMKTTAESIPGLKCYYDVTTEEPTGTCAVSVAKANRSLCTRLGATAKLNKQHVESLEQDVWMTGQMVCLTGFFVTAGAECLRAVAKSSYNAGRTLVLTLSAPFIVEMFPEDINYCAKLANVLIGNESEWDAFRKVNNCKTVQDAMTWWIQSCRPAHAGLPDDQRDEILTTGSDEGHPEHDAKFKLAVCTRGDQETLVAMLSRDGPVSAALPVPRATVIVDTNGCGDAFLGGLLAALVQKETSTLGLDDIRDAVRYGTDCARLVLSKNGFDFRPEEVLGQSGKTD